MKAWHFVGKTLRDGSPIPPDGVPLVYKGNLIMCQAGYHASLLPFDALRYAPGATLCLVEVSGKIIQEKDKLVAQKRTIIARMEATEMLQYYARMQALSVSYLWEPSEIVLDFLMTGENAQAAAYAANAAYAAYAAHSAANAAHSAAYSAAYSAHYAANAAHDAEEFNSLVYECFGLE